MRVQFHDLFYTTGGPIGIEPASICRTLHTYLPALISLRTPSAHKFAAIFQASFRQLVRSVASQAAVRLGDLPASVRRANGRSRGGVKSIGRPLRSVRKEDMQTFADLIELHITDMLEVKKPLRRSKARAGKAESRDRRPILRHAQP